MKSFLKNKRIWIYAVIIVLVAFAGTKLNPEMLTGDITAKSLQNIEVSFSDDAFEEGDAILIKWTIEESITRRDKNIDFTLIESSTGKRLRIARIKRPILSGDYSYTWFFPTGFLAKNNVSEGEYEIEMTMRHANTTLRGNSLGTIRLAPKVKATFEAPETEEEIFILEKAPEGEIK